jgi:hypothetical protein
LWLIPLIARSLRRGLGDLHPGEGERETSTKTSTLGLDGDGREAVPVVGLEEPRMLVTAKASALHHSMEGRLVGGLLDDKVVRESKPVMEGPVVLGGELEGGVTGLDGPGAGREVRSDEDV